MSAWVIGCRSESCHIDAESLVETRLSGWPHINSQILVAGAGWPSPVDRQLPVAGPAGELRSPQIAPGDLVAGQLAGLNAHFVRVVSRRIRDAVRRRRSAEPAFYAEPYPDRDSENEKAGPKGPALFILVAGA